MAGAGHRALMRSELGAHRMGAHSGERPGAMPYGRLTKYQLSARVRGLRAEHRHLVGTAGSLARPREIRRELTKLLAAQSPQRAVTLLSRALAVGGAPISTDPSPEIPPVQTSNGRISVH
jgi:hypothetical protein